jgi:hypothetical protein
MPKASPVQVVGSLPLVAALVLSSACGTRPASSSDAHHTPGERPLVQVVEEPALPWWHPPIDPVEPRLPEGHPRLPPGHPPIPLGPRYCPGGGFIDGDTNREVRPEVELPGTIST